MRSVEAGATARTTSGSVRGTDLDGVHAFLGVPYAAAPVGPRRFEPPGPPESWDGVRDARRLGPTAPQPVGGLIPQTIIEGDDYLHLNVYTPELGGAGLPVFVWIHGGGMSMGSNAEPWDRGARLARRGLVVVSPNYRLGVDGFLPLRDAGANRGVLDWLRALEWVQENVAAFGGDPGDVTVGGYSAGSAASLLLLSLPQAAGLFRRVVAMSGVPWNVVDLDVAEVKAANLTTRLGVDPTADGLAPVERETLLAIQNELAPIAGIVGVEDPLTLFSDLATSRDSGWLGPVVDGRIVPRHPMRAIADGAGADVPVVIGSTMEEMDALIGVVGGEIDHATARQALVGIGLDERAAGRWLDDFGDGTPAKALGAALTALSFRLPLVRVAESRFGAPAPTYVYEVGWRPPTPLGAVHGFDVPFAFDNLDVDGVAMMAGGEPPRSLADELSGALARFVVEGDPGWPRYDEGGRRVQVFDVPSSVRVDPDRLVREIFADLR